jgi:alkylation response protein AidB-like acyl-CoA dehydrogenase
MLLRMKALTEAARALLYLAASNVDRSRLGMEGARTRVDLLTPLAKAYGTDIGCEVASLGIQVHGGMGFIEETGAAQHYRDARIAPIYEGTNGIQAADLVGRKLTGDGGTGMAALIAIPYSYLAPASYVDTNIHGTLNVVQAARDLGVSRVVHTP